MTKPKDDSREPQGPRMTLHYRPTLAESEPERPRWPQLFIQRIGAANALILCGALAVVVVLGIVVFVTWLLHGAIAIG